MKPSTERRPAPRFHKPLTRLFVAVGCLLIPVLAQPPQGGGRGGGRGRGGRGAPANPRASAAIDMTGYWVSVVTEDWRYRMVTPPKGQYLGIPLTQAGRREADAWDPAKDEAAGLQCRGFGAAAIMRVPGRFHITWTNDTTMQIDADSGTQTRVFHFGGVAPADTQPSWQGYSIAQWEPATTARGEPRAGDLKVVTTHMLAGYVRKNGVPYSANAVLTEYYDRLQGPNGDEWLVVTTEVNDPQNFTMPFVTTTHFKKEPDATGWDPQPCSAK